MGKEYKIDAERSEAENFFEKIASVYGCRIMTGTFREMRKINRSRDKRRQL